MTQYYKEFTDSDKTELEATAVIASLNGVDWYESQRGDIQDFGSSVDSFFEDFCEPITVAEARLLRPKLVEAMEQKEKEQHD